MAIVVAFITLLYWPNQNLVEATRSAIFPYIPNGDIHAPNAVIPLAQAHPQLPVTNFPLINPNGGRVPQIPNALLPLFPYLNGHALRETGIDLQGDLQSGSRVSVPGTQHFGRRLMAELDEGKCMTLSGNPRHGSQKWALS